MSGMGPIRENPAGLTSDAADNIRRLNHATQGPGGYWAPHELDQVIGNLQLLAERLEHGEVRAIAINISVPAAA